jgi:hypothetical protein
VRKKFIVPISQLTTNSTTTTSSLSSASYRLNTPRDFFASRTTSTLNLDLCSGGQHRQQQQRFAETASSLIKSYKEQTSTTNPNKIFYSTKSLLNELAQESLTDSMSGKSSRGGASRTSSKASTGSGVATQPTLRQPMMPTMSSAAGFKRLEIMKSQQELIEECKNSLNELIKASKWSQSGAVGADNNNNGSSEVAMRELMDSRRKSESNRSLAAFASNNSTSSFIMGTTGDERPVVKKSGMKKSHTLINQTLSSLQQQQTTANASNPFPSSVSTHSLSREAADFSSCMHLFERIKSQDSEQSTSKN